MTTTEKLNQIMPEETGNFGRMHVWLIQRHLYSPDTPRCSKRMHQKERP